MDVFCDPYLLPLLAVSLKSQFTDLMLKMSLQEDYLREKLIEWQVYDVVYPHIFCDDVKVRRELIQKKKKQTGYQLGPVLITSGQDLKS